MRDGLRPSLSLRMMTTDLLLPRHKRVPGVLTMGLCAPRGLCLAGLLACGFSLFRIYTFAGPSCATAEDLVVVRSGAVPCYFCPYLLSSETTAKGTGLAESAGKEDPVELDSSLTL
ncbi:hypothetical protein AVEN_233281-1 [Araneus ventricosus]|uniref:Uncharacterized protein n=1 Tax=Araneus ventricosus TaxID=182803 RepID=A0A4Y2SD65_ARAVE|nr:hypothetical protein AVEN_233281-1 [Araneus ventricosus]